MTILTVVIINFLNKKCDNVSHWYFFFHILILKIWKRGGPNKESMEGSNAASDIPEG